MEWISMWIGVKLHLSENLKDSKINKVTFTAQCLQATSNEGMKIVVILYFLAMQTPSTSTKHMQRRFQIGLIDTLDTSMPMTQRLWHGILQMSSGQTLGVKAQRFRGHTSPHRNVKEFGRRLFPPAQNPQGILEQRDPVYQNMFNIIENSIRQGRPMAGSLFWRLFYPTYAGEQADDYGVKMQDTTAKIIKEHARQLNLMMNSIPAKQECGMECWVPTNNGTCELQSWACEQYFQSPSNHTQLFFTSQAECCWPVRGAFMEGCKNLRTLV
eukprot:TRINITY_DN2792_c0_g2_i1.p2 TRINITY_DN2792_c0_g2~~TRINITY_DN2792_c0_g2_i1.p2  ORF type:complete len:270 (-),score=26.89 TRINITY_DN2792_c0_g2_i1:163-972(-)